MLEVKNLMVFFENALALNDFSMKVNQGEIIGVIGSNSAGKTTLMNTISGLIIDMKIKEQRKGDIASRIRIPIPSPSADATEKDVWIGGVIVKKDLIPIERKEP